MIRYPVTNGVWMETDARALQELFKRQQARIEPVNEGTTRKVRLAFFLFVAVALFPVHPRSLCFL
jgi:hypothetical protein